MQARSSTNGFVLAGGLSRRMGREKATLPWGDRTLLSHMIQLLSTVSDSVRVVGQGSLSDRIPGKGPLGGILTALEASDQPDNLIVAVDLPLLTPQFLKLFHARFRQSPKSVLVSRVEGRFPLCLAIRREMLDEVTARVAAGNLAVHRFIEQADPEILEESDLRSWGISTSVFDNINTPEDWGRLRSLELPGPSQAGPARS